MADYSMRDRLSHAWNAFRNKNPATMSSQGSVSSEDRPRRFSYGPSTLMTSICNRIAVDTAKAKIEHVVVGNNGLLVDTCNDGINQLFTVEANIDQNAFDFKMDILLSMMADGYCAVVPVDTTTDINQSNAFDVNEARVGRIVDWYTDRVQVELYNPYTGRHQQLYFPKSQTLILTNPFYDVMNSANSTLKNLNSKLALLDIANHKTASKKLDLILQLPYSVKSESRRKAASDRLGTLENQLADSEFGIAYIDGTEKITQLNRSVDNNLLAQIQDLTNTLYAQLGLTPEIMNGTADESVMTNYYKRTCNVFLDEICAEVERKWFTKTARTQGHAMQYYRNPFELMSIAELGDTADKLARNEIMASNELRAAIGLKPSKDTSANELRNPNMPVKDTKTAVVTDDSVQTNQNEGVNTDEV